MKQVRSYSNFPLDAVAFGTYSIEPGEKSYRAVTEALEVGYRSFDTAKYYNNEKDVGRAVRDAGLEGKVHITTKVWIDELDYKKTKIAGKRSRDYLGVECINLLLLHWPRPNLLDSWQALLELQEEGVVSCIGVSNFEVQHIESLAQASFPMPEVNQIELSPLLAQKDIREYCHENGIIVEAWAPLLQGALHKLKDVEDIAEKHDASLAQLALRWAVQKGLRVIPKSVQKQRMQENLDIFRFEISAEELGRIDALDSGFRCGPTPFDMYHLAL